MLGERRETVCCFSDIVEVSERRERTQQWGGRRYRSPGSWMRGTDRWVQEFDFVRRQEKITFFNRCWVVISVYKMLLSYFTRSYCVFLLCLFEKSLLCTCLKVIVSLHFTSCLGPEFSSCHGVPGSKQTYLPPQCPSQLNRDHDISLSVQLYLQTWFPCHPAISAREVDEAAGALGCSGGLMAWEWTEGSVEHSRTAVASPHCWACPLAWQYGWAPSLYPYVFAAVW